MKPSRLLLSLLPLLTLMFVLVAVLPPPALAGCKEDIAAAEKSLPVVEAKVHLVREENQQRLKILLEDAQRLIGEAKGQCGEDQPTVERAAASSKALLAQGKISSAALLIKVD